MSPPLKIALITRRYPPLIGGAEKVLSYLAPALADAGAEVTVLTANPPGLGLPALEDHGRWRVVRLATSPLRFVGTWLYMRNLRRLLARDRPDLAYVSMLKHDAYVAVGEGRRRGFPVVLRPEGAGATGDLAWQSWGRFGKAIGRRCRQADAIVSIAPVITEELTRAGHDPGRIHDIPNGVPVPDLPWQPREAWRDAPRAAFVGRLAPEKGLDTLVEAWAEVRASHPHARLVLIGEGPERPALEAQASRLGLGESIEWPGKVADPTPWLRGSDLFVLPSREEAMSIALLEAMALGMPLVATAIPGNRRLIHDGEHGRLVPPDDPRALARGILEQWANPDRALDMARAARSRVAREFSIEVMARRHLELFRSLLDENAVPDFEDRRRPGLDTISR